MPGFKPQEEGVGKGLGAKRGAGRCVPALRCGLLARGHAEGAPPDRGWGAVLVTGNASCGGKDAPRDVER